MEKKLYGNKSPLGHFSGGTSSVRSRSNSSNSLSLHGGNNLSVEVLEVHQGKNTQTPIVGGPYVCVLEVIDPSLQHAVWKQKCSPQFTGKPPIIFGDLFKVKNFSGEWPIDIKPGFTLRVQFCKIVDRELVQIDSGTIDLQYLVVNKEQRKVFPLESDKAEVVLRLTLSNPSYPRANTLTLSEIEHKEKEKEEKTQEQTEQVKNEGAPVASLQRTLSSYSLPRLNVRFSIHYHTSPGEDVRIVGSNYKLGDWDATKAPVMEWTHGDMWVLEISFRKAFIPFEYKYVVFNNHTGAVRWETVPSNRKVEVSEEDLISRSESWERL